MAPWRQCYQSIRTQDTSRQMVMECALSPTSPTDTLQFTYATSSRSQSKRASPANLMPVVRCNAERQSSPAFTLKTKMVSPPRSVPTLASSGLSFMLALLLQASMILALGVQIYLLLHGHLSICYSKSCSLRHDMNGLLLRSRGWSTYF